MFANLLHTTDVKDNVIRIRRLINLVLLLQKNSPACSCVDCEQSCPEPPPPPPLPQPFTIFGYDGYEVTMTIIFVCGSCLFLLLVMCFSQRKRIGKKFNSVYITSKIYFCLKLKRSNRILAKFVIGTN